MLPSYFVMLEGLPLTPNGKVDRKALPAPDRDGVGANDKFVAPETPTEATLAQIWADLLKLKEVGINDNFFELGGHSLLATQLMSRVRETLHVEIALRTLFEAPTVAELAKHIEAGHTRQLEPQLSVISPASRDGKLPLSFVQQRLWFLDQVDPGNSVYAIPGAVRLSGQLKVEALEMAINEISETS